MPKGKNWLFLLPLVLFLFLVCSELVERSMYNDGVLYSGLSENMANGIGTFWNPKFSEIQHPSFHEHPPLVFGIQSLFFRVLGDSLATERIYAGSIFLLSAWLMVLLWREALRGQTLLRRLWFVPLVLWLANEVVYHFYAANVLEPTMTLFTLAAVYACLRSVREGTGNGRRTGLLLLAGLLVAGGTLCKGFVALFPLAFFGIYWLVYRRTTWLNAVGSTALMIAAIGVFYGILLQYEPARESLWWYFDSQVLASMNLERSFEPHFRSSRFYIIKRMLTVLIPAILLTTLLLGAAWRGRGKALLRGDNVRPAILFLLLGAAASVPLMISPKQSFYYLLPSMAYYALGAGLLAVPAVAIYFARPTGKRASIVFAVVMPLLLLAGILNTAKHFGQVTRRDVNKLTDIEKMNTVLPERTTVGSAGNIDPLVVYMYRTHYTSIDTVKARQFDYPFLVARQTEPVNNPDYVRLELGLTEYALYRRNE